MFDNLVTVYRNSADVWFYVVGSHTADVANEDLIAGKLAHLHLPRPTFFHCHLRSLHAFEHRGARSTNASHPISWPLPRK